VWSQGGFARRWGATWTCAGIAVFAAIPSIGRAQTAGQPPAADATSPAGPDAYAVSDLVVTARYKAESVQAVPLSIVAIGAQEIEDLGAQQFADYAALVPGLSFQDRGPNRNNVVIRGISPFTGNSAVGIYLDGIEQSNFNNNPDFGLFDIDRIEILRGPQGTLYGEGSLGGTIRVFTTAPQLGVTQAQVEAIGSGTEHSAASGAVNAEANLPVGDEGAIRVSGYDHYQSGWIDNVDSGQKDVNDNRDWGARAAARYDLGPNFDLQAIVNYQDDKVGLLNVQDPTLGRYKIGLTTPQGENQTNAQYTILANYKVLSGTIEEVVGYNDERDDRGVDSESTLGVPNFNLLYNARSHIFSNETRYVSDFLNSPFNFVLGVYYKQLSRFVALDLVDGGVLFGVPGDFVNAGTTKDQTVAVYGETYYAITDRLKATVGLRWSQDDVAFPLETNIGPIVIDNTNLSGTYSATTPKFGLAYQWTPNVLVFTNIAEGYRPGGINSIPDPSPFYVKTYQPDSAWSYEVGVKAETADHRFRANASVYYIDWRNLQILGEPDDPALGFITNAGRAHSEGFEAEFSVLPIRGLELDAGVGYANPRLDAPAEGLPKGATLPGVSKLNVAVDAQYDWPLKNAWRGVARVDAWLRSDTDTAPWANGVNLRLGAENARWAIYAFVKNATNNLQISVTGAEGQFIAQPRTIGVDVRRRF
jgi:outer membrane receptor protein involved in Fe transport